MQSTETRNEKLDLRLTSSAKRALQSAALAAHRSVSEFVLEERPRARRGDLARSPPFRVERRTVDCLPSDLALAAPPLAAPRLAKLLKEPSVFERGKIK